MHKTWPIAIDGVSVCKSVTHMHPAKIAEQIDVLFGVETFLGPSNIVLNLGPDPPMYIRCCVYVCLFFVLHF